MSRTKASKIHKEDEEPIQKGSINGVFADKEQDEIMSVNAALEKEKEEAGGTEAEQEIEASKKELALEEQKNANDNRAKGIKVPPAKALRNPKKDKDPIEGEDLGLAEDDFLLTRKVTKQDLEIHNKVNKKELLGSNVRKPRDLVNVFRRGPSTNETPKVDTMYAIENNAVEQKEIAAKQLLRNYHSSKNKEKNNMKHILRELKIDDEIIKQIKEDKKADQNENLINIIKDLL